MRGRAQRKTISRQSCNDRPIRVRGKNSTKDSKKKKTSQVQDSKKNESKGAWGPGGIKRGRLFPKNSPGKRSLEGGKQGWGGETKPVKKKILELPLGGEGEEKKSGGERMGLWGGTCVLQACCQKEVKNEKKAEKRNWEFPGPTAS